jgi:hypothetical protein
MQNILKINLFCTNISITQLWSEGYMLAAMMPPGLGDMQQGQNFKQLQTF